MTLKWGRIKGFASVIGSFVSEFLPDELKVKPNGTVIHAAHCYS